MAEEGLRQTAHKKIIIGKLHQVDINDMEKGIEELKELVSNEDVAMTKVIEKIHCRC